MSTNQIIEVASHLRRAMSRGDAAERSDGQLLEDYICRRDEAAFAALVHRHGQMVWGVCRRVLGNHHDAEDAFQAAFLVLVRKATAVSPREMVANWLHGVAYQSALHARRTVARRRSRECSAEAPEPAAIQEEIWNDLKPLLDEELRRLPDPYRAAVVLCDLEGKTRKEAAQFLGCPEGTVAGRLARGRSMLAKRLVRRGLAVTVGTLTSLLTEKAMLAAAPTSLTSATIKGAYALAEGLETSLISPQVIALTQGVRKAMALSKHKIAALVFLAAGVVGLAASGLMMSRLDAAPQPEPQTSKSDSQPARPTFPGGDTQPADAELHVIAAEPQDHEYSTEAARAKAGGAARVDVEVRPTDKPVILVLTAYSSVDWHVKLAKEARVKKVIVSGYFVQEVQGVPADIPVVNQSHYPRDGSRRGGGWFYSVGWNTPECREMVRRLNRLTGLPVATFQEGPKAVSFVVDGKRGRDLGQKEIKYRASRKELTPQELLAISADCEMHVAGVYMPDSGGKPVNVEVRATAKPIVLVLASYSENVWNIMLADKARIKAVIVGGWYPQEIDGLPAEVPIHSCCPDASCLFLDGKRPELENSFYAYRWNTLESRRMVEKLNDMTGLLVSTFQGEYYGKSFVVDGARGSEFAQKERKAKPKRPEEPTPKEFLAACTDGELHLVSIYAPNRGESDQVDVEVRPTARPVVLVLASYYSVLWNVKIAKGAQVQAVVIGGYYDQEFEGIPVDVPVIYRARCPGQKSDYFYGHEWDKEDCRAMVEKLKEQTGLLVTTFQGEYTGKAFVVNGIRGSRFAQKERKPK